MAKKSESFSVSSALTFAPSAEEPSTLDVSWVTEISKTADGKTVRFFLSDEMWPNVSLDMVSAHQPKFEKHFEESAKRLKLTLASNSLGFVGTLPDRDTLQKLHHVNAKLIQELILIGDNRK